MTAMLYIGPFLTYASTFLALLIIAIRVNSKGLMVGGWADFACLVIPIPVLMHACLLAVGTVLGALCTRSFIGTWTWTWKWTLDGANACIYGAVLDLSQGLSYQRVDMFVLYRRVVLGVPVDIFMLGAYRCMILSSPPLF
ncbi:hypothetical protein BDW69DRAFT_146849 [Aspergillus filifer]